MFIVIEGLDGAGTSTQTRAVAEVLRERGHSVSTSREPSDGPVGELIRRFLSGDDSAGRETLALLFAADRLDHLQREVEPALSVGEVAISDRYYASSLAYQADPADGGADYQWVEVLNERARTPDLTVFLRASAEVCLDRLEERTERDIFESRQQLEMLERRYDEVMDRLEQRGERILRLDATRKREELTAEIAKAIEHRIDEMDRTAGD